MRRFVGLVACLGCATPTSPSDTHSMLLINSSQQTYSGLVVSKPTEAFRIEFSVQSDQHACLMFQSSQLRGDSVIVIASYFGSDVSHPVGDTLTIRSGLNWTWDGFTASLSAACS